MEERYRVRGIGRGKGGEMERQRKRGRKRKRKLNERGGEEISEVRKWNSFIMQMDITTELEDKYYYIFCM